MAPADDASLAEKFETLDEQLHAAAEENKRLRAELERMREEVDPVGMLVGIWQSFEPAQVQAQLTKIIEALNLSDCLSVDLDEIR